MTCYVPLCQYPTSWLFDLLITVVLLNFCSMSLLQADLDKLDTKTYISVGTVADDSPATSDYIPPLIPANPQLDRSNYGQACCHQMHELHCESPPHPADPEGGYLAVCRNGDQRHANDCNLQFQGYNHPPATCDYCNQAPSAAKGGLSTTAQIDSGLESPGSSMTV